MSLLLACLSGLIFGLGLLLSGMSHPAKVQGFLDITGAWDPSLAFTMAGAIGVAMPSFFWAQQRSRTWLGLPLALPVNSRVDRRLVLGSVLFGIGWGLSGICPGPALVGLGGGFLPAMVFVAGFCGGILAFNRRSRPAEDA
ncbi:MAG TPA: YeeE/YedE family protein [Rhodocyclaceae bacterium]|nr:YeeE/YedE family protein [Rhodocyclaceae bacterium]